MPPSVNQIAVLGRLAASREINHPFFTWEFTLDVLNEYDDDKVDVSVNCRISGDYHEGLLASAAAGDWITVQGKLRNGFIQVRSFGVFKQT